MNGLLIHEEFCTICNYTSCFLCQQTIFLLLYKSMAVKFNGIYFTCILYNLIMDKIWRTERPEILYKFINKNIVKDEKY